MPEWDVFGRYLNEPYSLFDEAPCEKATQTEAAGVVRIEGCPRLQRKIKREGGRRLEQPVRVVQRAKEALALIIASFPHDRTLCSQLLEIFVPSCKPASAHAGRGLNTCNCVPGIGNQEGA